MGRYAQARRRGGGGGAPPSQPPHIVSVLWDVTGLSYDVLFSAPITYDNSGSLGSFSIDADDVATCVQASPTILVLTMVSVTGAGGIWSLSDQPPQISTVLEQPDDGAVV